jgi:hypothetical protein
VLTSAKADVLSGNASMAIECDVFALSPVGDGAPVPALPIAALPTSKKVDAGAIRSVWEEVIDHLRSSVPGPARLWGIATDGNPVYTKAFRLLRTHALSPSLTRWVGKPAGLDLRVAEDDLLHLGDPHHLTKRIGSLLSRHAGMQIGAVRVTPLVLVQFSCMYSDCAELTPVVMASLVARLDPMNTTPSLKLLRAVARLTRDKAPSVLAPDLVSALAWLADLCGCWISLYDLSASLSEQLVALSRLAHLLYAVYAAKKVRSALMPPVLFSDLQVFACNSVILCAKAILHAHSTAGMPNVCRGCVALQWRAPLCSQARGPALARCLCCGHHGIRGAF